MNARNRMLRAARIIALAAALNAAGAVNSPARQPGDGDWMGKRVVQKNRDFLLKVEKQVVDRKSTLRTYRVEQVNGQWLWLRAEGLAGWARADQVVRVEQAIAYYTDYIRDHPDDPYGYSMRATLLLDEKKDPDAALRDYSEAIRLDPSIDAVHANRGNVWTARKEYDKAIADYNEAIRLNPAEPFSYSGRGLAWHAKKEYDKAIADFTEAIRLYPEHVLAYTSRGSSLFGKNERDRAIADYDAAIRIDPENVQAYLCRGHALLAAANYTKAIADYSEAIRLAPRDAKAYADRGAVWSLEEEYDKAIADFDEAIRLDPHDVRAYVIRGHAWLNKKEYDKAIADATEAIRLDPKRDSVYVERGDAWREKGEWVKSAADYTEAIRLEPNQPDGYEGRACLWATCPDASHRDGKRAVEAATKACGLTEWKQPYQLDTLAAAYAEIGDFPSAVKWQAKAVALSGDDDHATEDYNSRLRLYRQKKPYRLAPASVGGAHSTERVR